MTQVSTEIRYTKDRQWQLLYLTLLLFAAIIGLFQFDIPLGELHRLARIFGVALSVIVGIMSTVFQVDIARTLTEYRKRLRVTEDQQRKKLRWTVVYAGSFLLLTAAGCLAACVAVWHDK